MVLTREELFEVIQDCDRRELGTTKKDVIKYYALADTKETRADITKLAKELKDDGIVGTFFLTNNEGLCGKGYGLI